VKNTRVSTVTNPDVTGVSKNINLESIYSFFRTVDKVICKEINASE